MANSLLDLVDSYSILSTDCDTGVSRSFLHSLDEFQALRCGSEKQLKTFAAAAVSTGLSTSSGIQAMLLLAEQCPDDFFTQHCKNWLDLVLGVSANAPHSLRARLSKLLTLLFRRSEGCPEQIRHISTISSSVIDLLISWIREGGEDSAASGARCLFAFLSTFPRACGGQSGATSGLEKFLLENVRPGSPMPKRSLVQCMAILPFLGGGGKEGILHRQRWTALAADLTDTLAYLVGDLLGKADTAALTRKESSASSVRNVLPVCGISALLPKMLFVSHQIETLSASLSEMLLSKCPHAKTLNLTSLFGVCQDVLMVTPNLGQLLLRDSSLDAQMLASCLPRCMAAVARLAGDVVRVARENCLLFVPVIINCSVSVLEDIRSIDGRLALQDLKCAIFSLLGRLARTLGCSSGLHISARDLLPLLLANIVPSQPSISLAKKAAHGNRAKNGGPAPSVISQRLCSPPKVCAAALEALADILGSCGALMSGQVLRELEPIVLSLSLEMQQSSQPPFNNSPCRKHLYQVLLALTTNPSHASPPSLHFASRIFATGRVTERNHRVAEVCRTACLAVENILHPRAPSFNPETTVASQELAEASKAAMKIHVVVLGNQSLASSAVSKRNKKDRESSESEEFGRKRLKSAEDSASKEMEVDVIEGNGVVGEGEDDDDDALAAFMANQKKAQDAERSRRSLQVSAESNDDAGVSEEDKKRAMEMLYDFSGESIFIPDDVREANAMKKVERSVGKVGDKDVEEGVKVDLEAMKSLFVAEDSDDE